MGDTDLDHKIVLFSPKMEKNSENIIFNVENSFISAKSISKDNNKLHGNGLNQRASECESEETTDGNISKFDKYVYTFLLCYANLTYGLSLTCMSPAFLDLPCVLEIYAELVSYYYTLFAIGTIIGSCFGFVFKYVNRQLVLIVALLSYGLVTTLLPIATESRIFAYLFGLVAGMGAATLDCYQTVWLIEMWPQRSGSILQLSKFAFGVGLFIGQAVGLTLSYPKTGADNCTNATFINETGLHREDNGHIFLPPFLSYGLIHLFGGVLLTIMYFTHRYVPHSKVTQKEIEEVPKLPRKTLIGLGAVCFATAIVSEALFIDFSPTFSRYYWDFEPSTNAILLSVMTASFTLTRAIGIFVAIRVRPEYILCAHYLITFSAIVILSFSQHHKVIAWTGSVLFGIGIATFWSTTLSHIENYFEITDRMGTIYVSLLGLLEMGTQFIEGAFLEKHPEGLLYYCFASIFISFVCFVIIRVIVFRFNRMPDTTVNSLANPKNNSHLFSQEPNVISIIH